MSENWSVVKSKRKNRKAPSIVSSRGISANSAVIAGLKSEQFALSSLEVDLNHDEITKKVKGVITQLQNTEFYHSILEKITCKLHETSNVVTLGVGRFSSSPASTLQLALAITLHKVLTKHLHLSGNVLKNDAHTHLIYDPILSEPEKLSCEEMGLIVCKMDSNDASLDSTPPYVPSINDSNPFISTPISSSYCDQLQCRTLYFMPHCPYQLYNEILWRHWGNGLEHIVIIGNSFESYLNRRLDTDDPSDCIRLLSGTTQEMALWDDKFFTSEGHCHHASIELNYLESAFNDLSVMWFPKESLLQPTAQEILTHRRPSIEAMIAAKAADIEMR